MYVGHESGINYATYLSASQGQNNGQHIPIDIVFEEKVSVRKGYFVYITDPNISCRKKKYDSTRLKGKNHPNIKYTVNGRTFKVSREVFATQET